VTSCDGRANVSIIDKNHYKLSSLITFKSNKQEEGNIVVLYPANTCGFNSSIENWFMTAGSDGVMSFWDLKEKSKIKSLTYNSTPICDAKVSPSGKTVVYALGNDWHLGAEGVGKWETKIGVHVITGQ
jgi:WD40 repeat protein